MTFEKQIQDQVQKRIINQLKEVDFIERWRNNKMVIPQDIIQKAWESINWDEVLQEITIGLQAQICRTIIGNMIAETGTDTKRILSVSGVRDKIKMTVYPELMKVLNNK